MRPSIDIVIPTFNRHGPLAECLRSLSSQSLPPSRVIIVDDASSEPVRGHIDAALRERLPLTVIRQEANGGPARARNRGVLESSADLVLFIDDDIVADRELVARHVGAHETEAGPVGVIGPMAAPPDWQPTPWCRWEAEKLAVEYERMIRGVYRATWRQFFTANASLRRECFLRVGGFDNRFTRAEDIELALRLHQTGCEFRFVPDAIAWHYSYRSLDSWLRIARDYARFDVQIDRLHPTLKWMPSVMREQRQRHPLTRAMVRATGALGFGHEAARVSARAGSLLAGGPLRALSMPSLSLAYSIEYASSLRAARREAASMRPWDGGGPEINRVSTG